MRGVSNMSTRRGGRSRSLPPVARPSHMQCLKRDGAESLFVETTNEVRQWVVRICEAGLCSCCLLYTSDAADE